MLPIRRYFSWPLLFIMEHLQLTSLFKFIHCSLVIKWSILSYICIKDPIITVYPKKYAHGFCFAVLYCGYTLTDFPISIRLTSLALWQSNDCPSASKATLMNMDKYFMWIHYERLHNHNKAKHNKTVCIFLGIYCSLQDNDIGIYCAFNISLVIYIAAIYSIKLTTLRLRWMATISRWHFHMHFL